MGSQLARPDLRASSPLALGLPAFARLRLAARRPTCVGLLAAALAVCVFFASAAARALPPFSEGVFHAGKPVALQGDAAPGSGGSFASFPRVAPVSGAGNLAFVAVISGGSAKSGVFRVVGGKLSPVALEGEPAPGTGKGKYTYFADAVVNDAGHVAFIASVKGSLASAGVFSDAGGIDTALALRGQDAPGGGRYGKFRTAAIRADGAVAFFATTVAPSGNGVFLASAGRVEPVFRSGEATPAGGSYAHDPSRGEVAVKKSGVWFRTDIMAGPASGGIFVANGGVVTPVVLEGAPTPLGARLMVVDGISANDAGQLLFRGRIDADPAAGITRALFLRSGGSLRVVAVLGKEAPDTKGGVFSVFPLGPEAPRVNASGEVIFNGDVVRGSAPQAIFRATASGASAAVLALAPASGLPGTRYGALRNAGLDDAGGAAWSAALYTPADGDASDADGDGVPGRDDNCSALANPDQCDTDFDGYGNRCDGDFDQNGRTDIKDFRRFLRDFRSGADAGIGSDLDCSRRVDTHDFRAFVPGFESKAPGPSGLACAGRLPCGSL